MQTLQVQESSCDEEEGAVEVRSTKGRLGAGFVDKGIGGGGLLDLLGFGGGLGIAPWLPAGFSLLVGT